MLLNQSKSNMHILTLLCASTPYLIGLSDHYIPISLKPSCQIIPLPAEHYTLFENSAHPDQLASADAS